jgi:aspartate/methionine/tyrosine aminotransferase
MLSRAALKLGLKPWEPKGGYFLWCDFSAMSREDDLSFAKRLLRGAGVAGVPGSVFFPRGSESTQRIRLTFSKARKTIREACERLAKFQSDCQIRTKVSA